MLSTREVATMLGRHYVTVLRWAKAGVLPPPKVIRSRLYWRAEDIQKFMEDGHGRDDSTAAAE